MSPNLFHWYNPSSSSGNQIACSLIITQTENEGRQRMKAAVYEGKEQLIVRDVPDRLFTHHLKLDAVTEAFPLRERGEALKVCILRQSDS